ncbi:two-component system sensor histidine kinase GacS [Marinobacter nanhaiticus D15-8W]|uniref:histidine kinase n=1 Tax=Marinobacter nanhaiticus D15-8W TaxID=626887 RepID=N6W8V7_9GAMM|nr:response regulator [Marinobacter nanhaiticus]ENO16674.1 hybrid sensor histidine kinase/response regulator [Marinobacter nanhaiticus D15-8W]BES72476.1 two-component system sensor histidine kinase GacS [Marinobacter nanhaiticus D15-8W]
MRRWGIRKKVIFVTLVPTILTTLILGVFFTQSWVGNIEQLLHDRGESLSRQLAAASEYGMFTGNRSLLNNLSNALLEEQDVRSITFFNARGERLIHTGPSLSDEIGEENLTSNKTLTLPNESNSIFIAPVFLQDLMVDSMLEMESRRTAPSAVEPIGWAVVEMSHVRTDKERYKALLISLLLILGGIAMNVLIALRMSRNVTDPIFELNNAVAKLKEGRLDTRVHTNAGPEFEQLESGLNAMAQELSEAQAEMQQNIDQATEDLRETLETIEIQNIELDLARKEALEASRIKSEFLANMSHEIRTPLNGIIGFTELLLKTPVPQQQRDHLNTIRKSSEILLTIINDILDFSKIEAGKLILDRVPFALRDTIEDVMVMLAPAAHGKNLDLVPLIYSDVPDTILGDPLRVKQVITNLVNNAIKFTQTGEVVLRASLEEEDAEGYRVVIRFSVSDSGVGLSRAQQKSLFNAFSQADASTARQYGGTGLGLVISKRLVEEMGGQIGLESELGKGSTFWFTLSTEVARNAEPPAPRDGLQQERVVYLEQQKTTALSVIHMLRDWGMDVDEAKSPGDLLEKVEQAQYENRGYAVAMVGVTRHLLHSSQYRDLFHTLEVERDCRSLILTPTLEDQEGHLTQLSSGHIAKPVCRDRLYDELFMLIHGSPAADPTLPAVQDTDATAPRSSETPRVLAVDDNEANLKLVLTLLADCKVQAEGASSGFEALSKARQTRFDLVFMDLQMPGMDGLETTERLRHLDERSQPMPVIALTAHALSEEKDRLLRQGFDGYLAKPVSSQQLLDTLYRHTGYRYQDASRPEPTTRHDVRQRSIRPSSREKQLPCVDVEEGIRLAAGKADLAEELFSMLLEQVAFDRESIRKLLERGDGQELLERVHKLHGATRYCGVPELRNISERLETAIKRETDDQDDLTHSLVSAMERLLIWAEETEWQAMFRQRQGETLSDS